MMIIRLLLTLSLLLFVGCQRRIDFEYDVPQRARGISQQQTQTIRAAQEVPSLKQKYREYSAKPAPKSLAQLQKEKKELEKKIARLVQQKNVGICAICKKKYNIVPTSQMSTKKKAKYKTHLVKINKRKRSKNRAKSAKPSPQTLQHVQPEMQNMMPVPMENLPGSVMNPALMPNPQNLPNMMPGLVEAAPQQPQPLPFGQSAPAAVPDAPQQMVYPGMMQQPMQQQIPGQQMPLPQPMQQPYMMPQTY